MVPVTNRNETQLVVILAFCLFRLICIFSANVGLFRVNGFIFTVVLISTQKLIVNKNHRYF